MKLCLQNNIPILHVKWLLFSIAFNFPLNFTTFDLNLHKDINFSEIGSVVGRIFQDNDETFLENCLEKIKVEVELGSLKKKDYF